MEAKNYSVSIRTLAMLAFVNTLVLTPFFNKDGMIIPKLILMFVIAMYLLPILIANYRYFFVNRIIKLLTILQSLILLHSLVVVLISSAPLEQQLFGRTGRGLGFITIFSLTILFMAAMLLNANNEYQILFWLIAAAFSSTLYSVLQSFGLDLLRWESRTNGVIGTLGNPNFQSAFAAMVLVPSFIYFWSIRKQHFYAIALAMFFIFSIYRTQSRQGFVAGFFSVTIAFLIYFWYKNRLVFMTVLIAGVISAFFAIIGMLNSGPLSGYLYNQSVASRGDFWRSAFNTANSHPFFGVGLDSFGDYSLKYRDLTAANHTFAEYTDNAHNFFLEQAATGGYPLALLNLLVVFMVLLTFYRIQKASDKFDPFVVSLFCSWVAFQMTSVISPGNLVTMYWNALFSGVLIGLVKNLTSNKKISSNGQSIKLKSSRWFSNSLATLGFLLMFPLFNTDRLQLLGMQNGDANLVIKASMSFPESTVRYSQIAQELLKSGLAQQALELSRSAVEFNPQSAGLWALIMVNPNATINERLDAKKIILELDPLNKEVMNYNP
jgi:O-antigen ligase